MKDIVILFQPSELVLQRYQLDSFRYSDFTVKNSNQLYI